MLRWICNKSSTYVQLNVLTGTSTVTLYCQKKSGRNSTAARVFPHNYRFTIVPYSNIITAPLLGGDSLDQVA
jgi:hypothetical protein